MFAPGFQGFNNPGFLQNGIIATFTSPQTLINAAGGARASLGPISQAMPITVSGGLPNEMAAAIVGTRDEVSQGVNDQMEEISVKVRFRSFRGGEQMLYNRGASMFVSLRDTSATAREDKVSGATIPLLNMWHMQRAIADYRLARGEVPDAMALDLGALRGMTARSPAEFAQLWAHLGELVEPSPSNTQASEPMGGVSVRGKGRTEVANIFGTKVKKFDFLWFVVTVETVQAFGVAQPLSVVRVRGHAGPTPPCRNTSKTSTPKPSDIDKIQKGVSVRFVWRETKYEPNNPPGSKYVTTEKLQNYGRADNNNIRGTVDLYQNGFTILVGIVTDECVKNPAQEELDAAHTNLAVYAKLPLVGICPLSRRS